MVMRKIELSEYISNKMNSAQQVKKKHLSASVPSQVKSSQVNKMYSVHVYTV